MSSQRNARVAPDERAQEIVSATRNLFSTRGILKTSFSDIAKEVGVARGLINAVLTEHIDEFVQEVQVWDSGREVGNIDKALRDCIALLRRQLRSMDPMSTELQRVENTGLYNRFLHRAVTAIVDCLQVTTVEAYAARHHIEINHVRETFYVLIYGLVGLARNNPAIGDDTLIDITRQVLRLPASASTKPDVSRETHAIVGKHDEEVNRTN